MPGYIANAHCVFKEGYITSLKEKPPNSYITAEGGYIAYAHCVFKEPRLWNFRPPLLGPFDLKDQEATLPL